MCQPFLPKVQVINQTVFKDLKARAKPRIERLSIGSSWDDVTDELKKAYDN